MQLYIVRHGIAIDREDPKSPSEPERFLTKEGIEKTKQAARGLASLKITADAFLSSPYVRAMQTAEIFAEALDFSTLKIRHTDLLLPDAEPHELLRELAKDKLSESVFVFGHATHVDRLIGAALGSKHPVTAMKKAGVALLDLKRFTPPSAQLLWLATPKLLRRNAK